MASAPDKTPSPRDNDLDRAALITQLRRKEGNWVDWAQHCQALQKAGMAPQEIFEETGFEPIQQNQIIVAGQVFHSMMAVGVDEPTQAHFTQRGSDVLYELRVLSQSDRARTAELALKHGLDVDEVKDLVKPIKEYSYRTSPPDGFAEGPGDAIAFHYWKLARQKDDLQARSRLIAQGLRFAESPSARQQIEQLLTDFTVVKRRPVPTLPLYRLESETELPRILPVAGVMPLSTADFNAVPLTLPEEPFGMVTFSGRGAFAPIPGWQVVRKAEDPVALLGQLQALPNIPQDAPNETVLMVIDRAIRSWDADTYFLVDQAGQIAVKWFEEPSDLPLLGKVVLIMRPKKILDEGYTHELWQIDE